MLVSLDNLRELVSEIYAGVDNQPELAPEHAMGTLSPYILFCPLTFPSCGTKCPYLYKTSSRTNVFAERMAVPYYIWPSIRGANAMMCVSTHMSACSLRQV